MTARASAIDELTESGVLDNIGDDKDSIDRELSKVKTKGKVDDQLERMKRERDAGKKESKETKTDFDSLIGTHAKKESKETKATDFDSLIGTHK